MILRLTEHLLSLETAGLITTDRAMFIGASIASRLARVPAYRQPDADDEIEGLQDIASTWIVAANDTRPAWSRGRVLWSEDDTRASDRERLDDAWRRMFGRNLSTEPILAEWDGGDCIGYLHPGGLSSWCVCGLGQIEIVGAVYVTGNGAIDRWNGIGA